MNVKSLLLAAVVASAAGSALANNFFETSYETQLAQASTTPARVATDGGYLARSDIPTSAKTAVTSRSRAEVRAETVQSIGNGEARAFRDLYFGAAQ